MPPRNAPLFRPAPRRLFAAVLIFVALAFFVVKLAAAVVLLNEGAGGGVFIALVTGLGVECLVWGALYFAGYPIRKTVLRFGFGLVGFSMGIWGALSWGSFLVTHTWMTWQRLSGAENVNVTDVSQLEMDYALPLGGVIALTLFMVVPALLFARRAAPIFERSKTGALVVAAGLVLFGADRFASPLGLFGLSEQPTLELLSSVLFSSEPETEPLDAKAYRRIHRPLAPYDEGPPPPTFAEQPRNVILYLAEGIGEKHTNFGGQLKTTPNVYRRYQDHGLWFDNYYTHTHRSIHAIFSVVCSEYPPPTLDAMTALHPRIDCHSMMETMQDIPNLHQGLFHGGRFAFANKLALLAGRGFEVTRDAQDLSAKQNVSGTKWHETWWGIDDRAVIDAALEYVDSIPKDERFFLMIIPIAPHEPYDTPKDSGIPKMIPGSTKGNRKFLRSVQFADATFERLMTGLEARGRYDDTMTVWVPDHGNHADEPARPSRGKRLLYQHNLHVPLVLLHPPSFHGERTHRLGGQIDLSPTLTAAMGAPADPRDRGQDLLSPAYERRRIYLLKTRGNSPFVGVVDGDTKFIYDIKARRFEYYDLKADPDERVNIAGDHLAKMRTYARDGVRFRAAQRQTLLSVPPLIDAAGSDAEIFAKAILTCAESTCPEGVKIEASTCKGKWAEAPCLRTKLKADVPVRIALPGVVGRYDSVRVRWWIRERAKAKKATLGLRYGDNEIDANKPRRGSDAYRVLPVPHDVITGDPPLFIDIVSPVDTDPVLEFVEH